MYHNLDNAQKNAGDQFGNLSNKLKVLADLIQNNNVDFSQVTLLIIQHIKENSIDFIRLLKLAGFCEVVVIGKPYSLNVKAYQKMKELVPVIVPTVAELESLEVIKKVTKRVVLSGKKFICLDLGGYFSRFFSENVNIASNLLGVVEDTKNGIWFDPEKGNSNIPIASVASGRVKDYIEHYFVAKAIVRNAENILINVFQQTLTSHKILLCGYGRIGTSISKILRQDSQVVVYDKDPVQLLRAKIDGFEVMSTLSFLNTFDSIIGITGEFVFGKELGDLKDGVFLINGSTRQREFDVDKIKKNIVSRLDYDQYSKINLKNKKELNLLAQGYPINFWNTESTPEFCLDAVFSEMFVFLQKMVVEKFSPGFYTVEKDFIDIEELVSKMWLKYWF